MATVSQLLAGKPREVYSIDPDEPVLAAIQMMADKAVGALLVIKDGKLSGIISERDYARKVILHGRSSAETPVWQIMSSPVTTVSPNELVKRCMVLMTEHKFRHLPVVDNDTVVGMLSIGDLLKQAIADLEAENQQLQQYIAS